VIVLVHVETGLTSVTVAPFPKGPEWPKYGSQNVTRNGLTFRRWTGANGGVAPFNFSRCRKTDENGPSILIQTGLM